MDTQTLMIFVKRILAGSSVLKATSSLGQLKKILTEQGAGEKELQLLEKIITSIPEMKQLLRQTPFTIFFKYSGFNILKKVYFAYK